MTIDWSTIICENCQHPHHGLRAKDDETYYACTKCKCRVELTLKRTDGKAHHG